MNTGPASDLDGEAAHARADVQAGDSLYDGADYAGAMTQYERASRAFPGVGLYHFKLAMAAWKAGRLDVVEAELRQALRIDPEQPTVHEALAQWYLAEGQIQQALEHSQIAMNLGPGQTDLRITRANVLASDAQYEAAWEQIQPLVASGSVDGRLAWAYAQIAGRIGHETQALLVLARAMRTSDVPRTMRSSLHFAAAGLLDRLGHYDRAFVQARLANESGRRPFDPSAHSAWISAMIDDFRPERLHALPRASNASHRPVFIVGMPRSGTSLIEQILASHPDVFGAGELRLFGAVIRPIYSPSQQPRRPFLHLPESLLPSRLDEMGAHYLQRIEALNATSRYVTDKMPLNFLMLGLIELLLPGARVIHCMRDPRDTCLSCYLTDFSQGNEFSFDLAHLTSYYKDYQRLMRHWRGVLSLPVLEVRYEEVVADGPEQMRRLLDFLDLPWSDRCLQFHASRRYVATASREQVRRPIYGSSIGRWKHYETHIGPLLILEDPASIPE